MTPRRRNLALTVVTLAVVAFSTVAFVRTQALKQEEAPIAGIRFDGRVTPGCDCPRDRAELSFTLERAQPITATIVDQDGGAVRTLLDGALRAGGRATLVWDGTDETGDVVPEGDYRLRVDLAVPDRAITIPADVRVEPETGSAGSSGPGD
jgi:hypothetical protein